MQQSSLNEIDIDLINENLSLSYEERIIQHQRMLDLIETLNQIGVNNRLEKVMFKK